MLISIITPSYNRASTLPRLFKSLEVQTNLSIEWIIVDDGSVDNTKEVVDGMVKGAPFPIKYFYKENGGMHTARNVGIREAMGQLVMLVDSDDALMPDAIECGLVMWNSAGGKIDFIRGRYAGEDGKIVGKPFPEGFNTFPKKKKQRLARANRGDCTIILKMELMKKHPFYEPKNVKFVLDSMLWNEMHARYECLFTNHVFGINYHDQENQLSRKGWQSKEVFNAYYLVYLDLFNRIFEIDKTYSIYEKWMNMLKLLRAGIKIEKNLREIACDIKKPSSKAAAIFNYIPMYIFLVMKHKVAKET